MGKTLGLILASVIFVVLFSSLFLHENSFYQKAYAAELPNIHSFKVYTGEGPPPANLGNPNDLYIDQESEFLDIYVKNELDVWEQIGNLQGDPGPPGPQGLPGTSITIAQIIDGELILTFSDLSQINLGSVVGPQGPPGLACWDLNENGVGDVPAEDTNNDEIINVLDCVGPQGPQGPAGSGSAGLNSAILTTPLSVGNANCQNGGVKIEVGLDSNDNNQLDLAEVNPSLTQFVCNGAQGIPGNNADVSALQAQIDDLEQRVATLEGGIPPSSPNTISRFEFENNVLDSVGTNHGTVTGTAQYVAGKVGSSAFNFGGSTYITLANENNFDFERTDDFSISFWIKTTSTGSGIITKKSSFSSSGFAIHTAGGGQIRVMLTNTANSNEIDLIAGNGISDNAWHHVVVTYNGNSLANGVKVYINGILQTNTVIDNNLNSSILNNQPLIIGAYSGTNIFSGQLDDIKIFENELTSSEVAFLAGI